MSSGAPLPYYSPHQFYNPYLVPQSYPDLVPQSYPGAPTLPGYSYSVEAPDYPTQPHQRPRSASSSSKSPNTSAAKANNAYQQSSQQPQFANFANCSPTRTYYNLQHFVHNNYYFQNPRHQPPGYTVSPQPQHTGHPPIQYSNSFSGSSQTPRGRNNKWSPSPSQSRQGTPPPSPPTRRESPSQTPNHMQLGEPALPPRHTPTLKINPRTSPTRGGQTMLAKSASPIRHLPPNVPGAHIETQPSNPFTDAYLVDAWMDGLIRSDVSEKVSSRDTAVRTSYTFLLATSETIRRTEMSMKDHSTRPRVKHSSLELEKSVVEMSLSPRNIQHLHSSPIEVTERLFEAIKVHPCRAQVLQSFIELYPKSDLHNHLTGAIYLEDYLKYAVEENLCYDRNKHEFHKDYREGSITAKDLSDDVRYERDLQGYRDVMMHTHSCEQTSTTGRHAHFFNAFKTIESLTQYMPLDKQIIPVVRHAIQQKVKYLELMVERLPTQFLPTEFTEDFFKSNVKFSDTTIEVNSDVWDTLDNWIKAYVEEQEKALNECNASVAQQLGVSSIHSVENEKNPIVVKYILEIMRDLDDHIFFTRIAAAMALINRCKDSHTVGLNIVGPEDKSFSVNHFQAQMKIIGFLSKKFNCVNISLHAGELSPGLADPNMRNHIKDSILMGNAKRIGHGVALDKEKIPELFKLMRERNVAVEICLSSNKQILKVKTQAHPIKTYIQYGVDTIICTDDEGITRQSLPMELQRAVVKYNLDYRTFRQISLNGIKHSFANPEEKSKLLALRERELQEIENSIADTIQKTLTQQQYLLENVQPTSTRSYTALTF